MKRIYKMIVEHICTGERKMYQSTTQGACPVGYRLIAVCGYYNKAKEA